jgi:hypothetical protein
MSNDSLKLIRARRAEIEAERRLLDDEEAELDQAEKTIIRLASVRPNPSSNGAGPKTQKEFVLHALRIHRGNWYENVKDLREAVAALGKDIPMSSFQPLISDMVNTDKTLLRDGSKVGLAATHTQGS